MVVTPPAAAAGLPWKVSRDVVPGLAEEHEHVDEARRQYAAAAVDDLGVADVAGGDVGAEICDDAVGDQHAAAALVVGAALDADRAGWRRDHTRSG